MNLHKSLILFLFFTLFSCNIVNAEKSDTVRTITVNGTGSFSIAADQATIDIGIETNDQSAHNAEQENARIAKAIQDNLLKEGIKNDKITTTRYTFYPLYNNQKGKTNEIIGYTVNNTISVTIDDLAKVGNIIDSSIRLGANKINSIDFSVKATDEMRKKVLQLAVKDANLKAQTMAAVLGKKIVNVVTINEHSTSIEGRRLGNYAFKTASADMAQTPIQPGNVDVNANIEITFEIL